MSTREYDRLSHGDDGWCCDRCFKEALPFFDTTFSDTDDNLSLQNPVPSSTSTSEVSAPRRPHSSPQLRILYTNCRSLPSNLDSLRAYAASNNPDIIALCETWLDETIADLEIFLPGYYIVRRDRNRRGGGILLYVRDSIPISTTVVHPTLELLSVELTLKQGPLLFCLIYRPPSADHSLSELELFLQSFPPSKLKSSVFLGDFNINLLAPSSLSHDITTMMSSFHFFQAVTDPTRVSSKSSSLIDHAYISNPSLLRSCTTVSPLGSSDHSCVMLDLTWTALRPTRIRRKMWSYKSADWDGANELLPKSLDSPGPESLDDVDSHWDFWKSHFLSTMSTCIPSRTITIKKSLPWINSDIVRVLRKRDYFFRLAKASFSPSARLKYCNFRNKAVSLVRKAKSTFLKAMSATIRTPKDFWSMYYSLIPNRERIPLTLKNGSTTASSPSSKANLLNSFFASCFSDAQGVPLPACPPSGLPNLSTIQCTDDEVESLLCALKSNTATGPDGISSHMLRNTWFSISSSLCKLFNHSLSSGRFPSDWKLSNVTPVYKSGDKSLISNYRPISLLSIPSKLLERIVHRRLLHHLLDNSFLSPRQFGFRPGSSTQEALLTATHDWHRCLDRGLSTAALFLDLSKAFDRVPHGKLLCSLSSVGVSGPLLQWFQSYLSDRSQRVVLNGHSSSALSVKSGVPQGSILGPLLFIVYIDSLAHVNLSPGTSIVLYADDILLYRTLSTYKDNALLQSDVNTISSWIATSGLALNPSKSTLLVISRQRVKPVVALQILSTPVPLSDSVKYLGVTLTSDLKWNMHVTNTCKSAKQKLGLLYRNFHQADQRTLTHLYKLLVLPKLDYCSSVWDPHTSALVHKLESVQSFAAKLCTRSWSDSSRRLFHSLNWPSLRSRRSRQKALLARRIIRNESIIPSTYYRPPNHLNPRIHHAQSVSAPFARTTSFQSSFFVSSCSVWNSLPYDVISLTTPRAFKAALSRLPAFSS